MAKKGAAHHGGAWKVAYADFVTAMMALFMVLWICAQDKKILLATSKYFKQPFNALTDRSVGVMQGKDGGSKGKEQTSDSIAVANLAFLNALASELNRMLNLHDVSEEKPVEMEITSDGLKITLFDRAKHAVFEKGAAEPTEWGRFVLQNLAWTIERNNLNAYIEGHAAKGFISSKPDYGAWELTTDRANMARRLLEQYAVDPKKIERIAGFGDTQPLRDHKADEESNDRISISLSTKR
jgi:chemotaxis protein MotB